MTNDEKIRVQILEAMARKGLRQAPLARRLGITPQSLNQVIKGDRAALPTSLTAVLDALELELVVHEKDPAEASADESAPTPQRAEKIEERPHESPREIPVHRSNREEAPGPEALDAETRAWMDAELAPPLEPYEWGDVDPEALGQGRVEYVPGEGWVVTEQAE